MSPPRCRSRDLLPLAYCPVSFREPEGGRERDHIYRYAVQQNPRTVITRDSLLVFSGIRVGSRQCMMQCLRVAIAQGSRQQNAITGVLSRGFAAAAAEQQDVVIIGGGPGGYVAAI